MVIQNYDSHKIKRHGMLHCWLCGLTENVRPEGWYGPWWLQIAHIASGGGKAIRLDDARAVILLCPRCHALHVSDMDRLSTKTISGKEYPTIDESVSLWLKRECDKERYDPGYLQQYWIGELPEPRKPPAYWNNEYFRATGIWR